MHRVDSISTAPKQYPFKPLDMESGKFLLKEGVLMRSLKELLDAKVNRDEMTKEEEKVFVEHLFSVYEREGFAKILVSPYAGIRERNGQKIKVVSRVKPLEEDQEGGADLECLPMWYIQFDDGQKMAAYADEIIPSEIKNCIRDSDKEKYLELL